MLIKRANNNVRKQLIRWRLAKKFKKQVELFETDILHPSLNTEKLEPKHIGLYSFRIDKQYRAIFRIRNGIAEILHISKHYQR